MDTGPSLPPKMWTSGDVLPQEGMVRAMLDRPIEAVDGWYVRMLGSENSPLHVGVETMERTGRLALLDVGCGTGNTLRTFADAVQEATGCPPGSIVGTGLSRYDYSDQSLNTETRAAFAERRFQYVRGKAEQPPRNVPRGAFDVVLSHEAIFYSAHQGAWVRNLRTFLRPGGTAFFNTPYNDEPPEEVEGVLIELAHAGDSILGSGINIVDLATGDTAGSYYVSMRAREVPDGL